MDKPVNGYKNTFIPRPMIQHESQFLEFIIRKGVGAKDMVASSPASYVSYLNSVSEIIGEKITPKNLRTEDDVLSIAERIKGQREGSTINNYCSAMRQYAAMVEAKGF